MNHIIFSQPINKALYNYFIHRAFLCWALPAWNEPARDWQDEAHHLLLERDSQSFAELIQSTRYEGHPLLGNLMVYLLVQLISGKAD